LVLPGAGVPGEVDGPAETGVRNPRPA